MDLAAILDYPVWGVLTSFLMVVATVYLAVYSRQLANAAKFQTAYFKRQETRELRVTYASLATDEDGRRGFRGITLANVGVPDITVIGASITTGIPVGDSNGISRQIGLSCKKDYQGKRISDFEPPHRLRSGDRINILYDLDELIPSLEPGQRVRHEWQDSHGNSYFSNWIDYHNAPGEVTHYDSPGKGFREPTM